MLLVLWLAAGALLLATLGTAPCDRTQEARVLLTADAMVGGPLDAWLVPRMNGNVRLRKPPLAYWLSAASFSAFGVSDVAGRIPAAVASWLTLGLVFRIGRSLFSRRAGLLAAAALLGCVGFFRFGRLAETDIYVALLTTAATWSIWRGHQAVIDGQTGRAIAWFHGSSAAIALAALAKGPPAGYPLLFLVVLVCCTRQWRVLKIWLISGALVTLVAIAVPWFYYISHQPDATQAIDDLRNSAGGGKGHSEWFWIYATYLLSMSAPWSGLLVLAIVVAIARWRADAGHGDWRTRMVLIWAACILLPLCAWGNKQPHYVLPLLPPLMLLIGRLADRAAASVDPGETRWFGGLLLATLLLIAVAAVALVPIGLRTRGHFILFDALASLVLVVLAEQVWRRYRRGGVTGVVAPFAALAIVFITLLVGFWDPSLEPRNVRTIAGQIRADFGNGPVAFVGAVSPTLSFYLGGDTPGLETAQDEAAMLARNPDVVFIEEFRPRNVPADRGPLYRRYDSPEKAYLVHRPRDRDAAINATGRSGL